MSSSPPGTFSVLFRFQRGLLPPLKASNHRGSLSAISDGGAPGCRRSQRPRGRSEQIDDGTSARPHSRVWFRPATLTVTLTGEQGFSASATVSALSLAHLGIRWGELSIPEASVETRAERVALPSRRSAGLPTDGAARFSRLLWRLAASKRTPDSIAAANCTC